MAVPNQQFVDIHRSAIQAPFLTVNKNEWVEASKQLSPSGFQMWLYLANIQDGYKNWELSKQALIDTFGWSDATYKRAKADLIKLGYLVDRGKNHLDFYTKADGSKNDTVVATKQESQDIGIKNEPHIGIKNDPVMVSKMIPEIIKENEKEKRKPGDLAVGSAPAARGKEVSRADMWMLREEEIEWIEEDKEFMLNGSRYKIIG